MVQCIIVPVLRGLLCHSSTAPCNDIEISSLAPCRRWLGCHNVILSSTSRECKALNGYGSAFQHLLVRPQYDSITNSEKNNKNIKNLSPYSPLTICYPCHDYSTCIRKTLVQSYCFHLFK